MKRKNIKICLISSDGGHLNQILKLKDFYTNYHYFFVTEKTKMSQMILQKEEAYYLKFTNRKALSSPLDFLINMILSLKYLLKKKPHLIISTGALSTVPMGFLGKIFGCKVVFIESFSKVTGTTRTGKFYYKFSDLFIIQREELKKFYSKAILGGELL